MGANGMGVSAEPASDPVDLPDYELLRPIGEGAAGTVWMARDRSGMLRAVKVLHQPAEDGKHTSGEAESVALVRRSIGRHPHLIEVFHVGLAAGRLYYVMELADAAPSSPPAEKHSGYQADTLAARLAGGARLTPAQAIRLALDLLAALEALHTAGLVHRDLKPENVVFVGGAAKLADMGLAGVARPEPGGAGTPGYAPPDGSAGPDADLYALGKLLYVLITGRGPDEFPAVPVDLIRGAAAEPFRRLNRVLLRACAQTSAGRYSSAAALRAALLAASRRRAVRQWATATLLAAAVVGWALWPKTSGQRNTGQTPDTSLAGVANMTDGNFELAVAALPADEQVRAVTQRLVARNPGFEGKVRHKVKDGRVTELEFSSASVGDLTPVCALPDLERLTCSTGELVRRGRLADLRPLHRLRLRALNIAGNQVVDLAPLSGLPLIELNCARNAVISLQPLRGVRTLKELHCQANPITDLAPLAGLPLGNLNCTGIPATDWSVLADLKRLTKLRASDTTLADLAPLAGASKLQNLECRNTPVANLGPLRGKPLTQLDCAGTRVASLEPLRGAPLNELVITGTAVSNLGPLAGTPLRSLHAAHTKVQKLFPLANLPLESLDIDLSAVTDWAVLNSLSRLRQVNGRSAVELRRELGLPNAP